MGKVRNLFLSLSKKIEKITSKYQGRLLLLMLIFLIMTILANLPYLNLVLTISNTIWIMIVIALFLFNISIRSLLLTALVFLILAFISVILGNKNVAEVLGNSVYLIILIVFLFSIVEYIREIGRS
ncbi:MAG: hypothetical protein AAB662_02635 [Patescibacteria group bacterium]